MSDRAKIIACWLGACLLFTLIVGAADITPGYTFTTGEKNITHTKLNDAASGTVNVTFYTGKSTQTAVTGDTLLYYAAADAAFRKTTVGTLFGNAPAINGLSTINSVGDFSVATSKFTVASATGNTAVGGNLTVATNLSVTGTTTLTGTLTTTNSATVGALSAASLGVSGNSALTGTLSVGSTFTGIGAASFWNNVTLGNDAGDLITFTGTMAGTVQGTPTVSLTAVSAAAGDSMLIADASDSGKLKMALLSTLIAKTNLTIGSVPNVGSAITNTHALGGVPQVVRPVLVCTNAELGYAAGDEVSLFSVTESSGGEACFSVYATSTNVAILRSSYVANVRVMNRNTGDPTTPITQTNWNLKAYMVYFP